MMENNIFEEEILPTTEKSKSIQAINSKIVHQICSGQVVLTLSTAVKELVENALDAGATSIEIKLKEHGKESIEVSDNGSGVEEENYQALTLKHHTSKLRDYSDLIGVSTFGFRGEALSSLCALSDITIITRHKNNDCGTKIEFDHNGIIKKMVPCPRQIGTTVTLLNLFSTLPVRQKEFHKNIKREFNKMTQLLYAYCLISRHAKIICTNQNKGCGRTIIVSTQANSTLRANIVNIFGSHQNENLLDIKSLDTYITEPSEIVDKTNIQCQKSPFQFEGVISSCAHGSGRSAADRQFYYINSRPCEPHKIIKAVNEVYKHYNVNQYPFVFLNIKVENQDVDVNVTPDKRQIFLNHEKTVTTILKQAFTKLFENIPSTMRLHNKSIDTSKFNQLTFAKNTNHNLEKSKLENKNQNQTLKRKMGFLERFACTSKQIKLSSEEEILDDDSISSSPINDIKTLNLSSDSEDELRYDFINKVEPMEKIVEESYNGDSDNEDKDNKNNLKISSKNNPILMPKNVNVFHNENYDENDISTKKNVKLFPENIISIKPENLNTSQENYKDESDKFETKNLQDVSDSTIQTLSHDKINEMHDEKNLTIEVQVDSMYTYNMNRPRVEMKCSLEDIKKRMKMQENMEEIENEKFNRIRFRSEIIPSCNESAEKELEREISKEMFSKMTIIGQFNLGFIIVKLEDDLFIIDQHASDEKFNFEDLQKNTILVNQKLVVPQTLELTAMNESILLDNLDIFERNGFKFEIDKDAVTTKRIKLSAIPMSKNVEFGKQDIDELLFMLQESSGDNSACRPSRVRSMLASRACRKSVMVGSPLTKADMRKLVDNMGTMDQPWNCPHGRPTMRHLVNLYLLSKGSEQL